MYIFEDDVEQVFAMADMFQSYFAVRSLVFSFSFCYWHIIRKREILNILYSIVFCLVSSFTQQDCLIQIQIQIQ